MRLRARRRAVPAARPALADEMLGASVKCLAHLGAEAAVRQSNGVTRNGLPVEPGGAGGGHLMGEVQIGAHRECDAPFAVRVVEGP